MGNSQRDFAIHNEFAIGFQILLIPEENLRLPQMNKKKKKLFPPTMENSGINHKIILFFIILIIPVP